MAVEYTVRNSEHQLFVDPLWLVQSSSTPRHRRIRRHAVVKIALTALLLVATAAAATPDWLFPARELLPALRAGSRDPATQAQLVYDRAPTSAFGDGISGEVSVSVGAAVLRLSNRKNIAVVVAGIEGAAFSRFAFQVVTRELVNTDWIFTVPLAWRLGPHWLRLRYFHTSSHLGDEYQRRFGPSSVNFSRDGVDVTGYARVRAGLGVYGLVFYSINSHPEEAKLWELRTGAEWDPSSGALWRPIATADVHWEEGTDWAPRWVLQTGVWLPRVEGRPLRLSLNFTTGPSPMGQFRGRTVETIGLGLFWRP